MAFSRASRITKNKIKLVGPKASYNKSFCKNKLKEETHRSFGIAIYRPNIRKLHHTAIALEFSLFFPHFTANGFVCFTSFLTDTRLKASANDKYRIFKNNGSRRYG